MLPVQVFVDLEGVEPSSKQGMNKLSTCLSPPSLSGAGKTGATNPHLILLNFTFTARPAKAISDFTAPLIQNASEPQLLSDVSSSYLVKG